ncbi:MAG: 2-amino-4-hydroxy-6-hydroxymethyldihydropteridine diphosphokinase [Armatimonadetes bacterium]|nr:2-amino-4-hydroxy-6-hydroxymethyldihydropteridine diphosphokinase [Armatimonadota bacterium]
MRTPCTVFSTRRAVVAFGSNVGDRGRHVLEALKFLGSRVGIVASSGLYETAPMYVEDQPPFLNGAVLIETDLDPRELLKLLKDIESRIGRQARERNGPREIDLDLIDFEGDDVDHSATLTVPHPRAHERRFVLDPMNEIAPDWVLNGYGAVRDLLKRADVQSQEVRRTADAPILL